MHDTPFPVVPLRRAGPAAGAVTGPDHTMPCQSELRGDHRYPAPSALYPNAESAATGRAADVLKVAFVDPNRFSQETIVRALGGVHPLLTVLPFTTVEACVAGAPADLDLAIYSAHVGRTIDEVITSDIAALAAALPGVPLIVMSDAEEQQQQETIREVLSYGVRGYIATRTMGIPLTVAVMRFVKAGGTYAPLELLLTAPRRAPAAPLSPQQTQFTARQLKVLSLLERGRANKTIAHELGMSESTVKLHVRNIMRIMGASNRTQAAYKAQLLSQGAAQDRP